jgi:hypothetical protein
MVRSIAHRRAGEVVELSGHRSRTPDPGIPPPASSSGPTRVIRRPCLRWTRGVPRGHEIPVPSRLCGHDQCVVLAARTYASALQPQNAAPLGRTRLRQLRAES